MSDLLRTGLLPLSRFLILHIADVLLFNSKELFHDLQLVNSSIAGERCMFLPEART